MIPLGIGGDHSVTWPILKALAKRQNEPLALIHIDAHTDTWGEFTGSKYHHGAPFRLATEAGVIDPKRTIQIGIRGGQNFTDGLDYSRDKGMRVITIEEFEDLGWQAVAREARRLVADRLVYLTFDIDFVDPAFAPGTGTPEAGGFTGYDSISFVRGLTGIDFIGFDMVEVMPGYDPAQVTSLLAANIIYEFITLVALSKKYLEQ